MKFIAFEWTISEISCLMMMMMMMMNDQMKTATLEVTVK